MQHPRRPCDQCHQPALVEINGKLWLSSKAWSTYSVAITRAAKPPVASSIKLAVLTTSFWSWTKNDAWFLKGVGGPKVQKGDLKAVTAIAMLRKVFASQIEGNDDDHTAVADAACPDEDTAVADDGVDPMDAMDALPDVDQNMTKKPVKKRAKKGDPVFRASTQAILVPTRRPCAGGDGNAKTVISVYRQPLSDKRTNSNLYLRVDCVAWLLSYAADELHFQGITPSSTSHDPLVGNCTSVPDLHVESDFATKEWDGRFVTGPMAGASYRQSGKNSNASMWQQLEGLSLVQGSLTEAKRPQLKSAAKELVILWGVSTARDFHAMDRNETRPCDEHAVAADSICTAAVVEHPAVAGSLLC